MLLTLRSKLSVILTFVATIVLSCGFMFVNISGPVANAAVKSSIPATTGSMQVAGTIDPMRASTAKAPDSQKKVALPLRRFPTSASTQRKTTIAGPRAAAGAKVKVGTLLQNFDGVNAIESRSVVGFNLEPPDEGLCVGNGYVINTVNLALKIYKTNGTLVKGPVSLGTFFNDPATDLSDPRCFFDKSTNTWFSSIFFFDGTNLVSHVDLAVSSSGDPTKPWSIYRIDTTDANHANCPCLPDYPIFGIDQYNVYLSTNEFGLVNSVFNGAQVYAIAKSQLISAHKVNYVHFENLSIAGTLAYHVQPAISYGNPNAEYFESSLDPNSTFDNRLGVWAMTNRQVVASGGIPNFTSTVISSEAYGFPVDAATPVGTNPLLGVPTGGLLQADFDAMQEVEYINGHLVSALDTAITVPGDTGTRDGVAWFEIKPALSGDVISSTTKVTKQGYLAASGLYLLYPHINRSANGTTAVTFSFTGPSTYPSAAYSVLTNGSFDSIQTAAGGVTSDNGFTCTAQYGGSCRWGDYSAGQLDPNSNNIWFATQYIPNNGNAVVNWGNRVFEIKG